MTEAEAIRQDAAVMRIPRSSYGALYDLLLHAAQMCAAAQVAAECAGNRATQLTSMECSTALARHATAERERVTGRAAP